MAKPLPERLKWADDNGWMTRDAIMLMNSVLKRIATLESALDSIPVYANNAAALAGGLAVGDFYRLDADPDTVCVVH